MCELWSSMLNIIYYNYFTGIYSRNIWYLLSIFCNMILRTGSCMLQCKIPVDLLFLGVCKQYEKEPGNDNEINSYLKVKNNSIDLDQNTSPDVFQTKTIVRVFWWVAPTGMKNLFYFTQISELFNEF